MFCYPALQFLPPTQLMIWTFMDVMLLLNSKLWNNLGNAIQCNRRHHIIGIFCWEKVGWPLSTFARHWNRTVQPEFLANTIHKLYSGPSHREQRVESVFSIISGHYKDCIMTYKLLNSLSVPVFNQQNPKGHAGEPCNWIHWWHLYLFFLLQNQCSPCLANPPKAAHKFTIVNGEKVYQIYFSWYISTEWVLLDWNRVSAVTDHLKNSEGSIVISQLCIHHNSSN